MKTIITMIPFVLLVGCGGNAFTKPDIVYVDKIITKECPEPPEVNLPDVYIYRLTEDDKKDPGKVAQYWKATAKQLMGAIQERDAIIEGYRKPK
jgi:hypothetical protein